MMQNIFFGVISLIFGVICLTIYRSIIFNRTMSCYICPMHFMIDSENETDCNNYDMEVK